MKIKIGIAVLAAIVAISSIACSGSAMQPSPARKSETIANQDAKTQDTRSVNPTVNPKIVEANTRFGFKLLSELLKDSKGNVFVSPSSVAIALSMAYNGANGETKQAMSNALELQGLTLEEINQAHRSLKDALQQADPNVQIAIANSLWARQDVAFNSSFIQRNEQFYDAKVKTLDFSSPSATQEINGWVKESTRGKISKIIDQVKPNQMMFLMNAMYFKGKWTNEFDKKDTEIRSFSLNDETQRQLRSMKRDGNYRYYETNQFQAISLPYGNERLSMYIFLPKSSLAQFQRTLTAENWQTWMKRFGKRQGSIQLPQFKLAYNVELKKALSALGMSVAFDNAANFSDLSSATTKIDQVKHKTVIEVNEEGTEAAAVTSIGIVTTSAPPLQDPFKMIVDRPFFCAIRDNQTGEILFMGSIVDPEQS